MRFPKFNFLFRLRRRQRLAVRRTFRLELLEARLPLASDLLGGQGTDPSPGVEANFSAYGPLQIEGSVEVAGEGESAVRQTSHAIAPAIGQADFDGDGWLDVLSRDVLTGQLRLHTGGSNSDPSVRGLWNPEQEIIHFESADFDDNGFVDVLGADAQGHWWLAQNSGQEFTIRYWGSQTGGQQVESDWSNQVAFDVDSDGTVDLISQRHGESQSARVHTWTVMRGSSSGLMDAEQWKREDVFGIWSPANALPLQAEAEAEEGALPDATGGGDIIPQGALQALVDLDVDDSSGATGNDFINGFTEEDGYVRLLDTDFDLNDLGENDITELVVQPTNAVLDGPNEFVIFRRSGGVSSVRLDGSETSVFTHSVTDGFPIAYQFDPTQNAVVWRPESAATLPTSTVRLLMDGLRYYNTDDDPDSTSTREFDIFVRDNSNVVSTIGQATINLTPVNDPPDLDLDGDNSSGAAPVILGRDSVDLTFVSSTNTTGILFNGDTLNIDAPAIFSSGLTATDPTFVAQYFERSEAIRLDDNTTAQVSFSGGTAPTGTLLYFHDVDQNESVNISSNSGTPRLVEQLETISGETTILPTWNPTTGALTGDTVNGVGGATIFDVSGFTDLTLAVGTPGTLEFGFITPGLRPVNYETTFTEGGPAVGIVDVDVNASDVDNNDVRDVSITLTNGQIGDQFVVDLTAISNLGLTVTGSPNLPLTSPGPLTLTLTGNVTHADIESALRLVNFENISADPNSTDRIVDFTLRDAQSQSLEAETLIHIIPVEPDIEIRKTDGGVQSEFGQIVVYTLTVENVGSEDVSGVVVTENLPTGSSFNSGSSTSGWSDQGGGAFQFQVGNLASGQSQDLSFAVNITDRTATSLSNTASVAEDGSLGAESNTNNNSATDTTPLVSSTGTISGRVYDDSDNNGQFDSSQDSPIAGVTVQLVGTSVNGVAIQDSLTTDANGEYAFSNLPPGTYTVTETQPDNFQDGQDSTTAANPVQLGTDALQFSLAEGESESVNFGEIAETTTPAPVSADALNKRRFLAST